MSSALTEYLQLTVFPSIEGVYQRELRQAYDDNAQRIDAGMKALHEALVEAVKSIPDAVPVATAETVGKVKPDGVTITVDEDGVLKATVKVEIATEQAAGIVKPDGDTILIDEDGTLHGATKVDIATSEKAGIVKPDGKTIHVDEDGVLTANIPDTYSKADVDKLFTDICDVLLSEEDILSVYAATSTLLGEAIEFTGLGANIILISQQAEQILK